MKKLSFILSILVLGTSGGPFAQIEHIQTANNSNGLPDNPSLWRVLMYKTGQNITKTGDAIQRSADKSSQSIQTGSERTGERIEQGADHAAQFAQEKAERVKTFTQEKWQQGKEAIVGTPNDGTVPIVQGTLSQPLPN